MLKLLIILFFAAIVLLVIVAKAIRTTNDGEYLVVFRLGQLLGVYPPGRTRVIPFIDRAINVNVEEIEGWRSLSEEELLQKLIEAGRKKLGGFPSNASNLC
ncbi:MAG TPA: SPFH domain-containing protein [Pyrinomonadaceae bacterium]|nr:SPFH domain-containing protein [Pyrinomonadaceae bacterium]